MIDIDYRLSAKTYGLDELAVATAEDLRYNLFTGDIVLRVSGVDFSTDWGWVPVLDFAVTLAKLAKSLPDNLASVFEFTESDATIELKLERQKVRVSASYVANSGVVGYDEFVSACHLCAVKLLTGLSSQYPSLKQNRTFMQYLKEFQI